MISQLFYANMRTKFLIIILVGVLVSGCASSLQTRRTILPSSSSSPSTPSEPLLASQLPPFPTEMNEQVEKWIDYFQGRGRERFELYLTRSGKYIPMIKGILRQYGIPEDLVYLAMIESGFNPHAYSRARAAGKWQFMYRTGLRYDLQVNQWVDQRRDPERSTVAAARHLRDLYEEFGDWYLALAGYNAGAGKVQRAVRRYGTRDFWELSSGGRRYFRSETRNYIPKMLAAAVISKNPQRYGFGNLQYERPLRYDRVAVDTPTDLRVAAECAGVTYWEVRELNPELVHWVTPPNVDRYDLKIPLGTSDLFRTCYESLSPPERIAKEVYTVQNGGTISVVAKKYGFPPDFLASLNQTSPNKQLAQGETVLIPYLPPNGERYRHADFRVPSSSPSHKGEGVVAYRVRRGDHLGKISRHFGVKQSSMRRLNPHVDWEKLRSGERIKLTLNGTSAPRKVVASTPKAGTGEPVVHRLLKGETLWDISRRYKVTIEKIKQWNGISNHRRIQPGQSLKIFVATAEISG